MISNLERNQGPSWTVAPTEKEGNKGVFLLKPHFICNLYIYIQQIGVRVRCNSLRNGTGIRRRSIIKRKSSGL
jgi:hypothetical protein